MAMIKQAYHCSSDLHINSDLSVCYLIHLMFTEGRSPCDAVQYP